MEQESNLVEQLRQEVEQGRRELAEQGQEQLNEREQEQSEVGSEELQQKQEEEYEVVEEYEEDLKEETDEDLEKVKEEKGDQAAKKFAQMRKENKEKEQQLQEMRERLARLEGMQQAQSPQQQKKEEIEPEPDKEEDIDAWYDYKLRQKDKEIDDIKKRFDAMEAQDNISKAERVYKDLESGHIEKDPSYKDAKAYLVDNMSKKIKQQYPLATDAQVMQEVKRQEYELVSALANKGFGEDFIFDVIKTQAVKEGFKESQKRDKTKLKRNMEKSVSLNDAPAASEGGGLTDKQIMRMSNEELAQASNDPKRAKQIRDVMTRARMRARA